MKDINIFVFGDSIAYGAFDKDKGGWVNRLRLLLENVDIEKNYNVFNLSISGEITEGIKNRFNFECEKRYDKEANNIIVFAIGINDSLDVKGNDNVSLKMFSDNISSLIIGAKRYSNNILFVGLTKVDESRVVPLSWDHEKSYFNKKILKFNEVLEKVCLLNNVNYLKVYDLIEIEELSDGLHPNEVGHQKLCDEVKNEIEIFID